MLRELHEQGLSISEIAKKTGYNRRTVRKYLESDVPPVAKEDRLKQVSWMITRTISFSV